MTTYRTDKTSRIILAIFILYALAYAYVRSSRLHMVENYVVDKGPRRDYITKIDHAPGDGWEYKVFFPAIKLEESISSLMHSF